jgi:uncharacterized spore protein YtfJ
MIMSASSVLLTIAAKLYPEKGGHMNVDDLAAGVRDSMTVSRVFGDAIERNGVTLIPVASVAGGGGGGGDNNPEGGSGGGFGLLAKPAGVYVIRGNEVSWQPALDLNRVIVGGQLLGLVALLTLRSFVKKRAKSRR